MGGQNEELRVKSVDKQTDIEPLQVAPSGLINALQSEVMGELTQIVPSGWRQLREAADTVSLEMAINFLLNIWTAGVEAATRLEMQPPSLRTKSVESLSTFGRRLTTSWR
jgi:hypothetical protein